MDKSNIEWLFFDLGGVLLDESVSWNDRITRTAERNDIPESRLRAEMKNAATENRHEYKGALERLGIALPEKWNSEFIYPYPDAKKVLTALKTHYKLGIIANQPLNTRNRLENEWGLAQYFDLMIISAEVGFSKPDPRLFREALYKAQTTADRCVMIGDKLTNDIAPAKALGFTTLWVQQEWGGMQTVTSPELQPDFTAEKISDILPYFINTP